MKLGIAFFLTLLFLFIVVIGSAQASSKVLIRYFYYKSTCKDCPTTAEFERVVQVLSEIMSEYGERVYVMMVDKSTSTGRDIWSWLNLTSPEAHVVVIGSDDELIVRAGKAITQENLEEVIDAFLGGKPPPSEPTDVSSYSVFTAFSLGFLDTFSPCLIAMLSFILSYTIGETIRFREGISRVITFGIGFVSAAVLLGAIVALTIISIPSIQIVLMWIICVFAIIFGLNLLGFFKVPIQTKPLIKKLAGRYATMYVGLFLLGFVFYFLDPCIAPFAFTMLIMLQNFEYILPLLMFCLGAIIPFIGIGILAGYTSKLARITYKHRFKIRAISGAILIIYALYLIIFYLF